MAAAHAARARALVEVAVDRRRGPLDYRRRRGCGDCAECQRGEEDGDGLVAHCEVLRREVSGWVSWWGEGGGEGRAYWCWLIG